jgi:hypothetical protein
MGFKSIRRIHFFFTTLILVDLLAISGGVSVTIATMSPHFTNPLIPTASSLVALLGFFALILFIVPGYVFELDDTRIYLSEKATKQS